MSVTQTDFRLGLLDPARPAPAGLVDHDGKPAPKRYAIYRNNVTVSLAEAMDEAFPVVRKLVGDEFFRDMARLFLRAHPPASPLMMHYGDKFPRFLKGFKPVAHLGYLPDVARLELALRRSYHAADAEPADAGALAQVAPDRLMRLRLRLAPAVEVLQSTYPIHAIWVFNMQDGAPVPTPGAQEVLVTRPEFDPQPALLPPGGAAFVQALKDGGSLGAALGKATAAEPAFDLSATLGLLIAGRAITAIEDPE